MRATDYSRGAPLVDGRFSAAQAIVQPFQRGPGISSRAGSRNTGPTNTVVESCRPGRIQLKASQCLTGDAPSAVYQVLVAVANVGLKIRSIIFPLYIFVDWVEVLITS
jgi:hypothetical protein